MLDGTCDGELLDGCGYLIFLRFTGCYAIFGHQKSPEAGVPPVRRVICCFRVKRESRHIKFAGVSSRQIISASWYQ